MKSAGGAAHAGNLEMAAEARERPVERAREPRRAVFVAGDRGAAPLDTSR